MSLDSVLRSEAEPAPVDVDRPRRLDPGTTGADQTFLMTIAVVGLLVVVVVGAIGVFLGYQAIPTFRRYGLAFLTHTGFDPTKNSVGILGAIVGTVEIAVLALLMAFPLALCTALYITEYAPRWARSLLVSVLDLMAALPSIVVGAVGLFLLLPNITFVARWLNQWLGWMPWFSVRGANPAAANFVQKFYYQSAFSASVVVAIMVIPLTASVMRGVFAQTPVGEREAALALGSTRWGVVRTVVLPFGRGGVIGGTMLGLGRALGETIAVLFALQVAFDVKVRILENGALTISYLVANYFEDSTKQQLSALLAAGFVLFLMTLAVNSAAAVVVGRSRSGADTDL